VVAENLNGIRGDTLKAMPQASEWGLWFYLNFTDLSSTFNKEKAKFPPWLLTGKELVMDSSKKEHSYS
jgi:hypothetical protein